MGLAFSPVRPRVCSAKRTRFFSLWLTARTTNCSSTLKKEPYRSKRLPNDRPRSLFGRSLEPLLSFEQQHSPFLLCPVPRRFITLSRQPFSPLAPLFFQPRAFAVFFPSFSMPELSAVCVAAPPYLSAPCRPPAPPDTPHCCFTRPRSVRLPGRPLAPLPGCLHPQWFCFSNDNSMRSFPPARRFPIKQITPSPPYVFTASRVNSRQFSLPEWRLRPSVFEGPPRVNFSARAPVSLLNKQQPSPLYVFNRAAINLSHPPPLRPAYRQCTAAHKNHLSSSFCIQTGGRRPCLLFFA